jgi:NADH-quinone oxidoreductase subunit L
VEIALMAASIAVAFAGIGLAWAFYRGPLTAVPGQLGAKFAALYRLVLDKYRIDEVYDAIVIRPLQAVARFLHKVVDVVLIDGLGVNGAAFGAKLTGRLLRFTQTGDVQVYVAFLLVGLAALFWFVW